MKPAREHIENTAYFGASDPVGWEDAVVSWSKAWARLQIKPRTGARYTQSLISCRPWLDGKSVHEIDNAHLKAIVSARAKQGTTNATIRRDITAISSVLGHCCDEGWIEENPAHMMDRSRFKEKKAKITLPHRELVGRYLLGKFAVANRALTLTG